jgi:hypothetical protein
MPIGSDRRRGREIRHRFDEHSPWSSGSAQPGRRLRRLGLVGLAVLAVNAAMVTGLSRMSQAATPASRGSSVVACPWTDDSKSVATRVGEVDAAATRLELAGLLYMQNGGAGSAEPDYEGYVPGNSTLCLPPIVMQDGSARGRQFRLLES